MSFKETTFCHHLYPENTPREEGFLKVSDLHTIFYALYGNPNGIPVVVLHGGPGAGCSDSMTKFFDLSKWNVIMFDQRGAMRSQPMCCMHDNSPQHSISDIETLRTKLGINKWLVFGGSWGTTLGLLYGQEHPDSCLGFILRGIFLGREQDYLHLLYGLGKIFPEAYEDFIKDIPEKDRKDLLSAYYDRVFDLNHDIHRPFALAFVKFATICSTHLLNSELVEKALKNDKLVLSMARAFFYYSKKGFFLTPNQILFKMNMISHLPGIIIHGRWDAIDLPEMAYLLNRAWDKSDLWMIRDGGHSAHDPAISAALATATDLFAEKLSPLYHMSYLSEKNL